MEFAHDEVFHVDPQEVGPEHAVNDIREVLECQLESHRGTDGQRESWPDLEDAPDGAPWHY